MACDFGVSHVGLGDCAPGYIYIATDGARAKIGSTRLDSRFSSIRSRLSKLNHKYAKNGCRFSVAVVLRFDGCVKGLEFAMHKKFEFNRIGLAELFSNPDEIIEYAKRINSYCGKEVTVMEN